MNYEEICNLLKERNLKRTSVDGAHKSVFVNEDYTVSITVEENLDKLTAEDEERIKARLRSLGYMD